MVACVDCGREYIAIPNVPLCRDCGGWIIVRDEPDSDEGIEEVEGYE